MRRLGTVLAAVAAMLALTAGSALAAPISGTLDQGHTSSSDGYYFDSGFYLAQTFTAGLTGELDTVAIGLDSVGFNGGAQPAAAGDYTLEIWATSGGVPSGSSALASMATGAGGGTIYFPFVTRASVVAGTQYAIVIVQDPGGSISWLGDCGADNYAGGQALVFDAVDYPTWRTVPAWAADADSSACLLDFAFETYVTVAQATPQPTTPVTPPPTATATSTAPENGSGAPVLLVFAGLASAAAFVTIRRYGLVRR